MKKKNNSLLIIIIALLLFGMTMFDTLMIFRITSSRTKDSGSLQLESISYELQTTIENAENLTMEMAIVSSPLLQKKEKLKEYIYSEKEALSNRDVGAFNVYIAGSGWKIIPGMGEDLLVMLVVMITSFYANMSATYRLGNWTI